MSGAAAAGADQTEELHFRKTTSNRTFPFVVEEIDHKDSRYWGKKRFKRCESLRGKSCVKKRLIVSLPACIMSVVCDWCGFRCGVRSQLQMLWKLIILFLDGSPWFLVHSEGSYIQGGACSPTNESQMLPSCLLACLTACSQGGRKALSATGHW